MQNFLIAFEFWTNRDIDTMTMGAELQINQTVIMEFCYNLCQLDRTGAEMIKSGSVSEWIKYQVDI